MRINKNTYILSKGSSWRCTSEITHVSIRDKDPAANRLNMSNFRLIRHESNKYKM